MSKTIAFLNFVLPLVIALTTKLIAEFGDVSKLDAVYLAGVNTGAVLWWLMACLIAAERARMT